jgi:hypothetical protein
LSASRREGHLSAGTPAESFFMRYFFHIRCHDAVVADPEGSELDGIETVRREAEEAAREMIADQIRAGRLLHIDTTFEVRDENDNVVLMMPFASVLLAALHSPAPRGFPSLCDEPKRPGLPLCRPLSGTLS